jgi:hypothetical protein
LLSNVETHIWSKSARQKTLLPEINNMGPAIAALVRDSLVENGGGGGWRAVQTPVLCAVRCCRELFSVVSEEWEPVVDNRWMDLSCQPRRKKKSSLSNVERKREFTRLGGGSPVLQNNCTTFGQHEAVLVKSRGVSVIRQLGIAPSV